MNFLLFSVGYDNFYIFYLFSDPLQISFLPPVISKTSSFEVLRLRGQVSWENKKQTESSKQCTESDSLQVHPGSQFPGIILGKLSLAFCLSS